MFDLRYKPKSLPQISAPYSDVLNALSDENVVYKTYNIDPNRLIPSQGIVFLDKIGNFTDNDNYPIWISKDLHILDGHHRYAKSLCNNSKIKCILIDQVAQDAAWTLNKIQHLYDYKNQLDLEKQSEPIKFKEILTNYSLDDNVVLTKGKKINKIFGYRNRDINENSVVGNFFLLKPENDDYHKFELSFENALDTNDLNVTFRSGEYPIKTLSSIWFPNLDFEKLSKKTKIDINKLIGRAVAEHAIDLGYDGIIYGDILIQALK